MSDQPTGKQQSKNPVHVHPHTKRLARHLRFTPNNLLYNRRGQLSPGQIKPSTTLLLWKLLMSQPVTI